MPWFLVDDRLHAHPKALATSLAALGLWTVAGSWSSDHLTDGVVPDHVIPLLCRGASELADELVAAGLWRRVRGGYRFHQWSDDGVGNKRNRTRKEVLQLRQVRADAGRKGGLTSAKTRTKRRSKPEANAQAKTKPADLYLSLPLENKGGENSRAAPREPPPRRCNVHAHWPPDQPVPPCGPCADARRAHDTATRANGDGQQPPTRNEPTHVTADGAPFNPGTGPARGLPDHPNDTPDPAAAVRALRDTWRQPPDASAPTPPEDNP